MRLRQSGSDKEGKAATVSNIDDVLLRPIAKGQARAQLQLVSSILQLLQKSEHCLPAHLETGLFCTACIARCLVRIYRRSSHAAV